MKILRLLGPRLLLPFAMVVASAAAADTVGKWRRFVVELPNATYGGNPFELEVEATFTHGASGARLTLPGYYAGDDTWKVAFMPTRTGSWSYVTSSPDSDLDGRAGSLSAVDSGHPGMLDADPAHPKKWKFTDGPYVVPIALRSEFFSEPASTAVFTAAADALQANHAHLMETRLLEEYGQFEGGRTDFVFAGDWRRHRFDLEVWDRMEQRMAILTERGLGAHVMLYSDDRGTPPWRAKSDTEALVVRYAVARLAAFPVVWFNTGIDIAEYRSQAEVDWLGERIRQLDPYEHPVSSRVYPISSRGAVVPDSIRMAGQTFDSRGDLRAEMDLLLANFASATVPVSQDDAWGEDRGSHPAKDHGPADIRRAFWKATVAGGLGGLIRGGGDGGSRTGFYYLSDLESDWESKQWLRLVNPFVQQKLGDAFGSMVPESSLAFNGFALSDPVRSRILYLVVGVNDRYDPDDGAALVADLSDLPGDRRYAAAWFDPRSGAETSLGVLSGGADHVIVPPSRDDWVLLLSAVTTPAEAPTSDPVAP